MNILNKILSLIKGSIGKADSAELDMSYDIPVRYRADYLAAKMVTKMGVYGTHIEMDYGVLTDSYDVTNYTVWLTVKTYTSNTAISAAIACHEVGHAYLCKNGFSGSRFEYETKATEIALHFLRDELTDEQFKVAERFLDAALKTYKS
jgi:hypothetical protein